MASRRFSSSKGPSQRQLRVGELIRRTLSEMLQRGEVHDPDLNRMSITVSEVRVSPDLRIATAFVLPLGGDHKREAIEALARNKGQIRTQVGRVAGLRHTPDIRFLIDESFDRMDATRALLDREEVRRDIESGDNGDAE
jgi:ribosome-binding factor A